MKTNYFTTNRITILFSLTALALLPLISKAQLKVLSNGNVGIGPTSPGAKLSFNDVTGSNTDGITWYNATPLSYGIFRTAGSWSSPNYQQLQLNWLTGIILNPGNSYGKSYVDIQGNGLRVTSGNVGIATPGTPPVANLKLDVNGVTGYPIAFGSGAQTKGVARFGTAQDIYLDFGTANASPWGFWMQTHTIANDISFPLLLNPNGGSVGIGTTAPAFKLDVTGTTGSIAHKSDNTTTWDQSSDVRLKTNITPFTDGLNIVKKINPVNYKYNGKAGTETILQHIGVLAQDIQQVAPYTVGTYMAKLDSTDTLETQLLTFNPHGLFFVLINAVKQLDSTNTALAINDSIKGAEIQVMQTIDSTLKIKLLTQDSIIASLQNQLNTLASTINSCCNENHSNGNHNGNHRSANSNQTNVDLYDAQSIVLEQNVPNPFAEQTSINYSLPDKTIKAQMLFYNTQGKLIQSTELTQKGNGILNVFASDLSSGIYTYTLVVDGKIIETKKMVKQ